jgi:hypothetical protein
VRSRLRRRARWTMIVWSMHPTSLQFLVGFLIAAGAGTAVFFHAERHKIEHPSLWASAVFLFLIVALPLYIIQAKRVARRS